MTSVIILNTEGFTFALSNSFSLFKNLIIFTRPFVWCATQALVYITLLGNGVTTTVDPNRRIFCLESRRRYV